MENNISCRYMLPEDREPVLLLLKEAGLPVEGLDTNRVTFMVAEKNDRIIGCGAIEQLNGTALLRSLAVSVQERGKGYGSLLVERLLAVSALNGIDEVVLLTVEAAPFFEQIGFVRLDRQAPARRQALELYGAQCCDTTVCMMKNIRHRVRYFPKDTLFMKEDLPGVKMWAVSLQKTMLTYFKVEPNSCFAEHEHESEQITMVLSGELFFSVQDIIYRVGAGEVIAIPSKVRHSVYTKSKEAAAVDAWSPVMEQYR